MTLTGNCEGFVLFRHRRVFGTSIPLKYIFLKVQVIPLLMLYLLRLSEERFLNHFFANREEMLGVA